MVLSVFLHMARVFYHGAYKPPREFNWVIGVVLLTLTLLLSFTGYLLPWDQLALWAVTVGTNMMGYTPVFGSQVRFVLLGGVEIGSATLLRWYVLHVIMLPFVIVIFMIVKTHAGLFRIGLKRQGRKFCRERTEINLTVNDGIGTLVITIIRCRLFSRLIIINRHRFMKIHIKSVKRQNAKPRDNA